MEELTNEWLANFSKEYEKLRDLEVKAAYERTKIAKIDDANEKKRRNGILSQINVHKLTDKHKGLYPITVELFKAEVEKMNSGSVMVDDYGNIVCSAKAWILVWLHLYEDDPEKLYRHYLTEVKPFIF